MQKGLDEENLTIALQYRIEKFSVIRGKKLRENGKGRGL